MDFLYDLLSFGQSRLGTKKASIEHVWNVIFDLSKLQNCPCISRKQSEDADGKQRIYTTIKKDFLVTVQIILR